MSEIHSQLENYLNKSGYDILYRAISEYRAKNAVSIAMLSSIADKEIGSVKCLSVEDMDIITTDADVVLFSVCVLCDFDIPSTHTDNGGDVYQQRFDLRCNVSIAENQFISLTVSRITPKNDWERLLDRDVLARQSLRHDDLLSRSHSKESSSYIGVKESLAEYLTNNEFKQIISNGNFIYIDGHFVINAP